MQLERTTLGAVSATFAGLLIVLTLVLGGVAWHDYSALERSSARTDTQRVLKALDAATREVDSKVHDWSNWNDTHSYALKPDTSWARSNTGEGSVQALHVDFIAIVDTSRNVVLESWADTAAARKLGLPEQVRAAMVRPDGIASPFEASATRHGIWTLPSGPVLVASRPLLTSEGNGPVTGAITFGVCIDSGFVADIAARTELTLRLLPPDTHGATAGEARLLALARDEKLAIRPANGQIVQGAARIDDLRGRPALIAVIDLPRAIWQQGVHGFRLQVLALVVIMAVLMGLTHRLLHRLVLRRVSLLGTQLARIGAERRLDLRVDIAGHDELGQLAATVNSALDSLQTAQESLRESELTLRTFYDNGGLLRGLLERDGERVVLVFGNGNTAAFFGLTPESLHDRVTSELPMPDAVRSVFIENLLRAEVLREAVAFDFRYEDGQRSLVMCATVCPVAGGEGGHTRFAYVVEDVTPRRRAEEALRRAKDEAEAANRAKSDFLATMSHEIRTPMNGVLGMAQLMLETKLTAVQREYAETILGSADALLAIINDILDLSKIESGRFTLESIPFDPAAAAEDVCELLMPAVAEKGLALALDVAPGLPARLVGDPGRFRQVLFNLAGNAVKFTPAGEVTIVLAGEARPGGRFALRADVRDTGIGIRAEKAARLFQPFVQADASMSRRFGGTGLGLAISRRLVETMGGTIGLTSAEGRGSTFSIALELPAVADAPARVAPPAALAGARVLVADACGASRAALRRWLEHWGARVDEVATLEALAARVRAAQEAADPVRLALADEHFTGTTGAELSRVLRAGVLEADVRLLLTGARHAPREFASLAQAGADGWLPRPWRTAVLAHVLGALLGGGARRFVTRETSAGTATAPEHDAAHPHAPVAATGRHVLLAEDNTTNQRVVVHMLEREGYSVTVAENGRVAVTRFRAQPFDLVLMDCQMPEVDGFEATRLIRSHELGGRHTPIVALTANAMEGDRERCIAAGMDDFVSKPVRRETLLAVIGRWCADDASGGAPRAA